MEDKNQEKHTEIVELDMQKLEKFRSEVYKSGFWRSFCLHFSIMAIIYAISILLVIYW